MFDAVMQVHLPEWSPRERGARDARRDAAGREGRLKLKCEFLPLEVMSVSQYCTSIDFADVTLVSRDTYGRLF